MMIQHLNLKKAVLNRPSTLAEAEVEVMVVEDKEAIEAVVVIKSLMTQIRAREKEVTLVVGGAREDARSLIWMQTVVAEHVESQTILKEAALGKTKEIGSSRVILHLAVISMILRGCLLCSI